MTRRHPVDTHALGKLGFGGKWISCRVSSSRMRNAAYGLLINDGSDLRHQDIGNSFYPPMGARMQKDATKSRKSVESQLKESVIPEQSLVHD